MLRAAVLLASVAAVFASDVPKLLEKGDALDAKNKNTEALLVFLEADRIQPNDAEVLRRVAKQYSQLIDDAKDDNEKEDLALKSVDFAQRAIKVGPKNSMAHVTLAIAVGRAAFLKGPQEKITLSRTIRDEAELAIELDSSNGLAWHVLGRWNYELANFNPFLKAIAGSVYGKLPDASNKRAAECLQKAVELGPPSVLNHVEYARALVELGKKEEARTEFEKGLSLPSTAKDDEETKKRAQQSLKSL